MDMRTRGQVALARCWHLRLRIGLGAVLACLVGLGRPQLAQAQPFTITQITNTIGTVDRVRGSGNSAPSINATGTGIAFVSDRDLTLGNPGNADRNFEIFLASSVAGPVPAIPTLTEWWMILLGLLLAGGMARALRRRAPSP